MRKGQKAPHFEMILNNCVSNLRLHIYVLVVGTYELSFKNILDEKNDVAAAENREPTAQTDA